MEESGSLHSRKREREEEQGGDRLSRLSDELIHLIMSFLTLQEAVRTCVLSKRWKFIWRSLPYLHFDLGAYKFKHGISDFKTDSERRYVAAKLSSFSNFVSQILVKRRPTNLVKVRFDSRKDRYCSRQDYRVDSSLVELVIYYAIQHQVQELDIRASSPKCIHFPSCFTTTCELLTTLKLESVVYGESGYSDIKDSNDDYDCCYSYNVQKLLFPALQTLHLVRFNVSDPDFYSRVFSSSPNLQNLKFVDCGLDDGLSIRAPNLKSLEIEFSFEYRKWLTFEVVVDTPKLTSFKFNAYDTPSWCFPCDLPSLHEVYFDVSSIYHIPVKLDLLGLLNTFKKFTDVKYLTLSWRIIEAFSGHPALVEESQLEFPYLKSLKLLVNTNRDFFIPQSLLSRFLSNFTSLKICSQ